MNAQRKPGLKYYTRIPELLKSRPEQRMTAREIAEWLIETYPDDCARKRKRTPRLDTDAKFRNQIVAEIGSYRKAILERNPNIRTTTGRPRQFYWTERTDEEEADQDVPVSDGAVASVLERDLYEPLRGYLATEQNVMSLRIDDKRAKNTRGKRGNRWLFPDIVGLEPLSSSWSDRIGEVACAFGDRRGRLWAIEVKNVLNSSNVRESFFQTVSNSTWANIGYLAAREIDERAAKELELLSQLHGIGILRFDMDSPSDSEVVIPARERDTVDWATCDRIYRENADFQKFLDLVRNFLLTGGVDSASWQIPEPEEDL